MSHLHLEGEPLRTYLHALNGTFQIARSFMSIVPAPCWIQDERGRFMYLNRLADKMFRAKSESAIGFTPANFGKSEQAFAKDRERIHEMGRSRRPTITFDEIHFGKTDNVRFSVLRYPLALDAEAFFTGCIAVIHKGNVDPKASGVEYEP